MLDKLTKVNNSILDYKQSSNKLMIKIYDEVHLPNRKYLYINRGRYVPASVCRGKAAARGHGHVASRGHGHTAKPRPRPRGKAAALRARGWPCDVAAYNPVRI